MLLLLHVFCLRVLQDAYVKGSVFEDVVPLCDRTMLLINEVFANPDSVMGKFVQHIFQQKIQVHMAPPVKTFGMKVILKFGHV
jgi:hypothetical protein